jgi:hypothetical protein
LFDEALPQTYRGYPVRIAGSGGDEGPARHRIAINTIRGFFLQQLDVDVTQPMLPADWLICTEQGLLSVTAGAVYHDDIGLRTVRARFDYYPRDVWLYMLVSGWARISEEEHLMGRAGSVGDEIGSAVIGARLVRDVMRLCFLMERTYAPYPKWFGTAFKRLSCAAELSPPLQLALGAQAWPEREQHLIVAYEQLAAMHNALGLTEPMPERVTLFFDRPFKVITLHGFADALVRQIADPVVKRIAEFPLIGSMDQFSDSTCLLTNTHWRPTLRQLYQTSGHG